MTGGVAYVFDQYGTLDARVNHESVELKAPTAGELAQIRELIQEHVDATQSPRGIKLLYSFETMSKHFVKVSTSACWRLSPPPRPSARRMRRPRSWRLTL